MDDDTDETPSHGRQSPPDDPWSPPGNGGFVVVWLVTLLFVAPLALVALAYVALDDTPPECTGFSCMSDREGLLFVFFVGMPFYLPFTVVAFSLAALFRLSETFRGAPPFLQALGGIAGATAVAVAGLALYATGT